MLNKSKTIVFIAIIICAVAIGGLYYKNIRAQKQAQLAAEEAQRVVELERQEAQRVEDLKRQEEQKVRDAYAKRKDEAEQAAKADVLTKINFKDPSSVQFRNIVVVIDPTPQLPAAVCGEYNAKNSFGAYVGFKQFFWNPGGSGAFLKNANDDNYKKVIEDITDHFCQKIKGWAKQQNLPT